MKKYIALILSFALMTALWACEKKPAAVVNGEPISEAALKRKMQENIKRHGAEGAKVDSASIRKAVLEQLISETLLLQGALEAGITVSEEDVQGRLQSIQANTGTEKFQQDLKEIGMSQEEFNRLLRERILKERFVENLLDDDPVTEEQLQEYYKNSPTPFIRPAEVEMRFIQFTEQAKADEAMQRIKEKKESFSAMADRLNESDEAIVSNSTWISPEFFGPEIRKALEGMKKNTVDGPFPGRGGIYIFRVTDRRPEGVKSYEEAKEDIRKLLRDEKKAFVVLHWVANKRKNSVITVN